MPLLVPVAILVGLWVVRALSRGEDQTTSGKQVDQPRAFISFDFDNDRNLKTLFAGQCSKNSPTPFSVQDWSSKEALPEAQWERAIHDKIGRCHLMFVLVSPTAHKAAGVRKEIQMASDERVPVIGVYVGGASTSTPLPKGVARDRTVNWDWKELKAAIERMLKEGKNR